MTHNVVYDIAGVGIDPFNLGLAALAAPTGLRTILFDPKPGFSWDQGQMPDFATLPVPFYADLVSGADPRSKYSYPSFLHATGRIQRSAVLGDFYPRRIEYNNYCRWAARQLPNLLFGHRIVSIYYQESDCCYRLVVDSTEGIRSFLARHIVIGNCPVPRWPDCTGKMELPGIFHSSDYISHREKVLSGGRVAIVGPGQAAAEIFYDLLLNGKWKISRLEWVTPAPRLYAAESSRFSQEFNSPCYIDYFQSLGPDQQEKILNRQDTLYEGTGQNLLDAIYGELYHNLGDCPMPLVVANSILAGITWKDACLELSMLHMEQQKHYQRRADHVILATGYKLQVPECLKNISGRLLWRADGSYQVAGNYAIDITGRSVFVQAPVTHNHGFGVPDLGIGPFRNAVILNSVLGYVQYKVEKGTHFQTFGIPGTD